LLHLSKIASKYNEEIDSKSAYEILNTKISNIAKEQEKLKEQKQSKSVTKRKSTRMNPVLKLVTSATFIRGVFGILNKILKK